MFQILISGTRNPLTDNHKELIRKQILQILSQHKNREITLIHGACTGVDLYADSVARELGLRIRSMPAQWNLYGKAAGPIRNSQMLGLKPNVLLAFPSPESKGTYDTIRKAQGLGIETHIHLLE